MRPLSDPPAVHYDGGVEGSLVLEVTLDLLDETQQAALTVGRTPC